MRLPARVLVTAVVLVTQWPGLVADGYRTASGDDGVPTRGAGTFAAAGGGTAPVGSGATLVRYRAEVEEGIVWGAHQPWTPAAFAEGVDGILAGPQGWIMSAGSPVTDAQVGLHRASWSFQRVSGDEYDVRLRLATPDTVDGACGAAGLATEGIYSCRAGSTIMINLRRWLRGAEGYGDDLPAYRTMLVNHEVGHFLGFDHMLCPGPGEAAPVMQTQTISLAGCRPNPYPFTTYGTFVTGPWTPS
ncbi:DUF3152 domain-containing protein [Catellatospora sp. NPDC049609]|uniref:DUF3152 domain-containing protein n=1 Tax=Catellatospora sp. NPDC049609 TaxID=3155505 RepID=UPI003434566F